VKFVSTIPGVSDVFPVKSMLEYKPSWVSNIKKDYKQLDKTSKRVHTSLCPGIFDLFKFGWYVPMWFDLYIKTKKDQSGFEWRIANDYLTKLADFDIVSTHADNQGVKYIPKRDTQIEKIVKINTPYHVIAPSHIRFLFLPMPYPDHFNWESASGILEPAFSSEVNIQLNWNVKDDEIFIKAGTPLMQIIPITENKINMECREVNEKELGWIKKRPYLHSFSFSPIRNIIKDIYNSYFN